MYGYSPVVIIVVVDVIVNVVGVVHDDNDDDDDDYKRSNVSQISLHTKTMSLTFITEATIETGVIMWWIYSSITTPRPS